MLCSQYVGFFEPPPRRARQQRRLASAMPWVLAAHAMLESVKKELMVAWPDNRSAKQCYGTCWCCILCYLKVFQPLIDLFFRVASEREPRLLRLSVPRLHFQCHVRRWSIISNKKDAVDEYVGRFEDESLTERTTTDEYYDVATDFYLYGWGHSFHFATRFNGESLEDSIVRQQAPLCQTHQARHEHFLSGKLGLKPGHKADFKEKAHVDALYNRIVRKYINIGRYIHRKMLAVLERLPIWAWVLAAR